jgi:hypothetical protein
MRRFWFIFEVDVNAKFNSVLGYGVTAIDYRDALELLQTYVFVNEYLPKVKRIINDVDVSTLDKGHILPNILPPNVRGIWYPMGFSNI